MNNAQLPSGDACYQALLTHDARFDGKFFVGVATTGIYCRTVCPAKTPKRENCTFYANAASAERAGFRPCLRCRPELAPGNAPVDAVSRLALTAAGRIEDGALGDKSLAELATELGVSDRHLRRVLESELGVSPVELAQTGRLLLAKRLLTDTNLPITEIAFASGFSSVRRFNALFQDRYRMAPTDLRKTRKTIVNDTLICELAYRPPFDWDALLTFLAGRACCGVESGEDGIYQRTVRLSDKTGWLTVANVPEKNVVRVTLSASLASLLPAILARVKRQFDLTADPEHIAQHLGELAETHPGLRVPGAFDGFEMTVRAILGQQVSVKAATTLAGRFMQAFGEPIETPFPSLTHLSPTAETVAELPVESITDLGITTARANTILALAKAVADGTVSLEPTADPERTMAALRTLPGIGEWTAQYVALRALSWPDAFPHSDLGLMKALGETSPKRMLELAEAYRPYRAYAVMHLWKSLETVSGGKSAGG